MNSLEIDERKAITLFAGEGVAGCSLKAVDFPPNCTLTKDNLRVDFFLHLCKKGTLYLESVSCHIQKYISYVR